MNNFKIYLNMSESKTEYIYLLNVQAPLLDKLRSRLVIPLIRKNDKDLSIKILNPEIEIDGRKYVLLTQQMASVPQKYLGKLVSETEFERTAVLSAIDFLITGY